MTISAGIEGDISAASAVFPAPFEEDVADFYDAFLVPILFEPYASEMAIVAERLKPCSVLEVAEVAERVGYRLGARPCGGMSALIAVGRAL